MRAQHYPLNATAIVDTMAFRGVAIIFLAIVTIFEGADGFPRGAPHTSETDGGRRPPQGYSDGGIAENEVAGNKKGKDMLRADLIGLPVYHPYFAHNQLVARQRHRPIHPSPCHPHHSPLHPQAVLRL
jgi:hypothetical protein